MLCRGTSLAVKRNIDSGLSGSARRWAHDGLEVHYYPGLDHATIFDAPADRAALLEVLSWFVQQDWAEGTSQGTTLHENGVVGGK
jgi:hypothetical protein